MDNLAPIIEPPPKRNTPLRNRAFNPRALLLMIAGGVFVFAAERIEIPGGYTYDNKGNLHWLIRVNGPIEIEKGVIELNDGTGRTCRLINKDTSP